MEPKELLDRIKRKESRRRRRELRIIVVIFILFTLSLILEINFSGLSQKLPFINSVLFFALMNVNIILIGLLLFLVFRNIIKLFWERHGRILGAKLKTKLVVVFVSFTLIPTILLFTVAAFYINNSFGRWFNYRITESLQNAVEIHNDHYQNLREKGFHFGKKISERLSKEQLLTSKNNQELKQTILKLQAEYGLDSVELFSNLEGLGISTVRADFEHQPFPPLEQQFLKEGFLGRQASLIQHLKNGDLIRGVMPVYDAGHKNVISALVVSSYVPPDIVQKIAKINATYAEYREGKTVKRSLKTIYITILLLMTLLIIFTAIWLGFHMARELTTPIRYLVEGTQAVAQGNLDVQIDYKGNDELAMLVKSFNKMTRDLKESTIQLAKAERVAAWREVARRIAHEIKNPLTPIKLSAQRLRRKYLSSYKDGVFDECTKMIITQVDALKDLVNEFSNFSKLPETNPRPSRLDKIIQEAIALYQGAHKHIKFEYISEHQLPVMELDRDQIKRVMINLLENAVSAIGKDKGRVRVRTRFNSTLQFVVIEVEDLGSGISDHVKSRLFEPYFSTKKGGTGLGLAIVRKIIADHQGYIRVSQHHPRGTRFIIELPLQTSQLKQIRMDTIHERTHTRR